MLQRVGKEPQKEMTEQLSSLTPYQLSKQQKVLSDLGKVYPGNFT